MGHFVRRGALEGEVLRVGYNAPNFPGHSIFTGELQDVRFFQQGLKDDEMGGPAKRTEGLVATIGNWIVSRRMDW